MLRAAGLTALAGLLEAVERGSRMAADGVLPPDLAAALLPVLDASRNGLRAAVSADPAMRRTWQLVDLVVTSLQGMAADGLLSGQGWERIDHLAYRDWLARHGATRETLDSPVVRGMQDLTFAYEGGDRSRPRFAAGLGLQLSGRMLFDHKGAVFWRMQAGMGEVVFAPLYQALRRRGVEFRFFSRLVDIGLAGRDSVGSISLARQADLAPGRSHYEPLVRVGGLPCWPASPADRPARRPIPGMRRRRTEHRRPTPASSGSSPAGTSTPSCWPSRSAWFRTSPANCCTPPPSGGTWSTPSARSPPGRPSCGCALPSPSWDGPAVPA